VVGSDVDAFRLRWPASASRLTIPQGPPLRPIPEEGPRTPDSPDSANSDATLLNSDVNSESTLVGGSDWSDSGSDSGSESPPHHPVVPAPTLARPKNLAPARPQNPAPTPPAPVPTHADGDRVDK